MPKMKETIKKYINANIKEVINEKEELDRNKFKECFVSEDICKNFIAKEVKDILKKDIKNTTISNFFNKMTESMILLSLIILIGFVIVNLFNGYNRDINSVGEFNNNAKKSTYNDTITNKGKLTKILFENEKQGTKVPDIKDQIDLITNVSNNAVNRIYNVLVITTIFFTVLVTAVSLFQFLKMKDIDAMKKQIDEEIISTNNFKNEFKKIVENLDYSESKLQLHTDLMKAATLSDLNDVESQKYKISLLNNVIKISKKYDKILEDDYLKILYSSIADAYFNIEKHQEAIAFYNEAFNNSYDNNERANLKRNIFLVQRSSKEYNLAWNTINEAIDLLTCNHNTTPSDKNIDEYIIYSIHKLSILKKQSLEIKDNNKVISDIMNMCINIDEEATEYYLHEERFEFDIEIFEKCNKYIKSKQKNSDIELNNCT